LIVKKRLILIYVAILATIGIVFFLSWLPNPNLGKYGFLPGRLAHWTDANSNMNLRTAVPLVLLGLFSGIWLNITRQEWYWWIATWLGLVIVVLIAEAGQLVLPKRHFDWGDVMWGALGAFGGMACVWVGKLVWKNTENR
jgi:hypothetical protein